MPELVEVDGALPAEVDDDLFALRLQLLDQLLALLDDRGVVATRQASVTGDDEHRRALDLGLLGDEGVRLVAVGGQGRECLGQRGVLVTFF